MAAANKVKNNPPHKLDRINGNPNPPFANHAIEANPTGINTKFQACDRRTTNVLAIKMGISAIAPMRHSWDSGKRPTKNNRKFSLITVHSDWLSHKKRDDTTFHRIHTHRIVRTVLYGVLNRFF